MKNSAKVFILDKLEDTLDEMEIEDLFDDEEIIEYIKKIFNPEDVFDTVELRGWADRFYSQ